MNLKQLLFLKTITSGGSIAKETVSGTTLSFTPGIEKELDAFSISFLPIQSGSGDPTPQNVRNITATTGITIYQTGHDDTQVTEYTATFPVGSGTIVGGTLNVLTGELTAQWIFVSKTWGEMTLESHSDNTGFDLKTITLPYPCEPVISPYTDYGTKILCNVNSTVKWEGASVSPAHIYIPNSPNNTLFRMAGDYDSGMVVQVAAKLAEPFTVEVDPIQITTRKFLNTITNSVGGTMTATYYKGEEYTFSEDSDNPVVLSTTISEPFQKMLVAFNPTQSGTGDPTHTNSRAITGLTGFTLTHNSDTYSYTFPRIGDNLFDSSTGVQLTTGNIRVARNQGQGVPFHLNGGVTYTFSPNCGGTVSQISLHVPYASTSIKTSYNVSKLTYTPESDADVGINMFWENGRPENATNIQIELGDTKSVFQPYSTTLYAGSLNVLTGVLTVTHLAVKLKLSDYSTKSTSDGMVCYEFNNISNRTVINNGTQICSIAKYSWNATTKQFDHFYVYTANNSNKTRLLIYLMDDGEIDETQEFTTIVPLETPYTIQLTAEEIYATVGTNTVSSSGSGNVTVVYVDKP